jgi:hypothetical protein
MCKAWIMLNENCFCYINTYWVLSMACDDKNYYVPQLEFFLNVQIFFKFELHLFIVCAIIMKNINNFGWKLLHQRFTQTSVSDEGLEKMIPRFALELETQVKSYST